MQDQSGKGKKPGDEELGSIKQLAALQKLIAQSIGEVEERLGDKITVALTAMQAYETKLGAEMQSLINSAVIANLPKIVEEATSKVKEEFKEAISKGGGNPGSGAPVSGLTLDTLLGKSDQIIGIVNAFRSPTTDQAMMGQMNFVMKWHSLLTKLEKGGGSADEITKRISETFTQEKQE